MTACKNCGASLTNNEIALYKRLVSRGATEYLCIKCLAGELGCTEEKLREITQRFIKYGCTLFTEE